MFSPRPANSHQKQMFVELNLKCLPLGKSSIIKSLRFPLGLGSAVNSLRIGSQKRLFSRQASNQNTRIHQNNGFNRDTNLLIKRKRFGISWIAISALFVGGLIFWPVILPIFAIGFATVITTGTMIFIGGWLLLTFAGVFVIGLALLIPVIKVYIDFRRIASKQALFAGWHVVDSPTSPWFGHRWSKPRTIQFQWLHQTTTIDLEGNVVVSEGSLWERHGFVTSKIHGFYSHFSELSNKVGKVVEEEARKHHFTSRKLWLERSWLYFFKFSIPFDLNPSHLE